MPSLLHEGLIELVRGRPAFVADLLARVLEVEVPAFTEARLAETTLHELVPIEYHADAVVLFVDQRPVLGVIVEAQLRIDERKRFTWPLYAVAARARYECPVIVLVVTPDRATAQWAAGAIELGGDVEYRVQVIGPEGVPEITDEEDAARAPELAMLSVIAHGRSEPIRAASIAHAAVAAIFSLPEDQRLLYSVLITSALSDAARKVFEMLPQTKNRYWPFLDENQRRLYSEAEAKGEAKGEARGEARGEAKGKAESVVRILTRRQIALTDAERERILGCNDTDLLDRWLDLALTAATGTDLFA